MSALLNKCVSCHDASGLLIAGLSKPTVAVFCTHHCKSDHTACKCNVLSSLICIGAGTPNEFSCGDVIAKCNFKCSVHGCN